MISPIEVIARMKYPLENVDLKSQIAVEKMIFIKSVYFPAISGFKGFFVDREMIAVCFIDV